METPSNIHIQFGDAHASGEGITVQSGVNNGTININQRPRKTTFPKAVYDATFDAANKERVPSCLPGTRVNVLSEIQQWIDGDSPKRLYWLNGMAGTGKSTIALTLARMYSLGEWKSIRLAGSFFFSRGSGDLSTAGRLAATIAMQLAEVSSEMRNLIEHAIEANPRLESLGVQEQWDKIIVQPLSQFYRTAPSSSLSPRLLVIVDALDECNDANEIKIVIKCLEVLTRVEGGYCRVFLTSRPDQPIQAGLSDSPPSSRDNFVLHDIERSIVDSDIGLYYRHQLSRIRGGKPSGEDILSQNMIDHLVHRSHGLFIHAATVCRFIEDGNYVAIERLGQLVESEMSVTAEQELDKMYATVLEYSFVSITSRMTTKEAAMVHELFQRIIGAIVVMFDAMSSEDLAKLLGETHERVDMALCALHSVIDVPDDHEKPIRILHPSFREYLLNAGRCISTCYTISYYEAHRNLVIRCFEILMSQLERNPVRIEQPGTKVRDVPIDIINSCIGRPLQYSSRYALYHILNSDLPEWRACVFVFISTLLGNKYLFWLENLAWIGQLASGTQAMLKLHAILSDTLREDQSAHVSLVSLSAKSSPQKALYALLEDSVRFIRTHIAVIEEAPLQIYASAIAFSPRHSYFRLGMRNRKERPQWILNEPLTPNEWSQSSRYISLHHSSRVYSVSISPDSEWVATACDDGMVHIWGTKTGSKKYKLHGNSHHVASVAFSSKGDRVVSLAHTTASIWNIRAAVDHTIAAESQVDLAVLPGDRLGRQVSIGVKPVSIFSPDGNLIAVTAGIDDIFVLDLTSPRSPKLKFHFQAGRGSRINALYFSADGSLLISVPPVDYIGEYSIENGPIAVWDIRTGLKVKDNIPPRGPMAFSSAGDGTRCITILGPRSNTSIPEWLAICDARTGSEYERFMLGRHHSRATKSWMATFPPEHDEPVVIARERRKVYLWDTARSKQPYVLRIHGSGIIGATLSQDANFVALTHVSNDVNVWDTREFSPIRSQWERMHQYVQKVAWKWFKVPKSTLYNADPIHVDEDVPEMSLRAWTRISSQGSTLVTVPQSNVLAIWNTSTGNEMCRFRIPKGVMTVELSPDGALLAALTAKGIHFWETRSGRKGKGLAPISYDSLPVEWIAFSPTGNRLFSMRNGWGNDEMVAWDIDQSLTSFPSTIIPIPIWPRLSISFSPNEQIYAVWSRQTGNVRVRISSNHESIAEHLIPFLSNIEVSPQNDRLWVLTEDRNKRNSCSILNIERNELHSFAKYDPDGYEKSVRGASFSGDGNLIALLVLDRIELYDLTDYSLRVSVDLDSRPTDIRFSSCGTHIITNRGIVPLPGLTPPPSPRLFVTDSWIQEDGIDIMAIPPVYRKFSVIVDDHTVTLLDPTTVQDPLFLKLDRGEKTMIRK